MYKKYKLFKLFLVLGDEKVSIHTYDTNDIQIF